MISPPPAPQQPQISPLAWSDDPQQCPNFVGFPTRAGFPADLVWSGKGEVPAIGARVYIHMNSIGPAEVKAYFHAEGYLGVLCQPETMPEHLRKHGITLAHLFGRELEPYTPGPHAPDQVPEVVEIPPAPGDWIPDYPPQEPDEQADDNQDSTEYPEHPQDEQRD